MQSFESGYNTRYSRESKGITDPEYSIKFSVQVVKDCLQSVGVGNPVDMEHIKLVLALIKWGEKQVRWIIDYTDCLA